MQIITNQFQKELKKHGSDHFPFLVSYQRLSEYDSNSFMWHYHPEIEITYIKKGSMHYRVNNQSFHLKEGDIIFLDKTIDENLDIYVNDKYVASGESIKIEDKISVRIIDFNLIHE